ncbi:MAG: HD domain-containing protein [Anaerolineaceae bacterium]|nr:HD domain-containing protein [Anaerolineaceae bacterium]
MILKFDNQALALFSTIQGLAADETVYLVGGAVRDALLGINPKDFDFVLPSGSLELARKVKKTLHGAGYTLDDERQTARVVLAQGKPEEIVLDFVSFTGKSLFEDLSQRDYTINAMAVPLGAPHTIEDPLGGQKDLNQGVLRVASIHSLMLDSLRAFRSIRLMRKCHLKPEEITSQLITDSAGGIAAISGERLRDELFKLLEIPNFPEALRQMQRLGLLEQVFPYVDEILSMEKIAPHVHDLWEHTLQVILYLEALIDGVNPVPERDFSGGYLSQAIEALQPYQERMEADILAPLQGERKRRSLLLLGALYHDVGKRQSRALKADGKVHFHDHPYKGLPMLSAFSGRLLLGTEEAKYLQKMVAQHMRIHNLSQPSEPISRRAIYRYFKELGPFGVDLALHSLADVLAAKEDSISPQRWQQELNGTLTLIEAWYLRQNDLICPAKILDGDDLMRHFALKPGPLLGTLLDSLKEAQAAGIVCTQEDAIAFSDSFLKAHHTEESHAD